MKLINKAYILIMVLIFVAIVNLVLFYQDHGYESDQSFSIIRVGDIKVGAESISGLVVSVASGNSNDKEEMEQKIRDVEEIIQ